MPLCRTYSEHEVWEILHQSEGTCLRAAASVPAHAMKWHSHGAGPVLSSRFFASSGGPSPPKSRGPNGTRQNSAYQDMGIQVRATAYLLNSTPGREALACLDSGARSAVPMRAALPRGRFPAATVIRHADGIHYTFLMCSSAIEGFLLIVRRGSESLGIQTSYPSRLDGIRE